MTDKTNLKVTVRYEPCNCHPETCNCLGWYSVYIGDTFICKRGKSEAEKMAGLIKSSEKNHD